MSWVWETTAEDIVFVFRRNGMRTSLKEAERLLKKLDHAKIEKMVLDETDMEAQGQAALLEIERQLELGPEEE